MKTKKLTDSEFWDERWSQHHQRPSNLSPRHPYYGKNGIFMKMLRKRIPDLEGKQVLELGGGGNNRRLLGMKLWGKAEVSAIDYSQVGLDQLQRLFQQHEVDVQLLQGDFFEFDYQNQQYDLVVHWGVLEHFLETKEFLRLCNRLLKPGGAMLFTMPNLEGIGAKLWKKWGPELESKHFLHPQEELRLAAEQQGFELVECFYFGLPVLALTSFEVKGLLPGLVSKVQWFLTRSSAVFPFYHHGNKFISMERGHYLKKVAEPS